MNAPVDDETFAAVTSFAHERWGLTFAPHKRTIVENRLIGLRQRLGTDDIKSVVTSLLAAPDPHRENELFNVLATNHTHFFREEEHFDILDRELLQPLAAQGRGKLRMWSAACSTGCEPYGIAMLIDEQLGSKNSVDLRILASDLSTDALAKARRAVYTQEVLTDVAPERIAKHFETRHSGSQAYHRVLPHIQRPVTLARLNLLDHWPMKGPFDAIFCRNVMIYFDQQTRASITKRMMKALRPGGLFFLGTSESLAYDEPRFKSLAVGAYRLE